MSDPVLIALLASIPPTVVALVSLVVGIRTTRKVEQVHKATNSLTDRLVEVTRTEAHAAGMLEERGNQERDDE